MALITDDFSRTVAPNLGNLGTSPEGGQITVVNGLALASVDGTAAKFIMTNPTQTSRAVWDAATQAVNIDKTMSVAISALPGGVTMGSFAIYGRTKVGAWNGGVESYYRAILEILATSTRITLQKRVDGVDSYLGTPGDVSPVVPVAGKAMFLRLQIEGTNVRAKTWLEGTVEPSIWLVNEPDSSLLTAGGYAMNIYTDSAGAATYTVDDASTLNLDTASPSAVDVVTLYDQFILETGGLALQGMPGRSMNVTRQAVQRAANH